ncbi:lipopolysaccharide assembly protein LapA domain-containing protein [Allorhizobium undicola]|uniref:lipopolysaccharide assembly protein LapA domain-containing protein n=1 Tax=Allorhizobium undicola TaxID=78527 RepID=UPI0004806164|nr:lipopolysaccharide assembly protein LapA domain-containing protein [Allorhizobium undicola]
MIRKIVNLVVLVPLAVVLVVLCVANRQMVTLALNPFRPEDQLLSTAAPFFVFLLLAFLVGAIAGAAATWLAQGKHRKRARIEARSAARWESEADRHRKRADEVAAAQLPTLSSR